MRIKKRNVLTTWLAGTESAHYGNTGSSDLTVALERTEDLLSQETDYPIDVESLKIIKRTVILEYHDYSEAVEGDKVIGFLVDVEIRQSECEYTEQFIALVNDAGERELHTDELADYYLGEDGWDTSYGDDMYCCKNTQRGFIFSLGEKVRNSTLSNYKDTHGNGVICIKLNSQS